MPGTKVKLTPPVKGFTDVPAFEDAPDGFFIAGQNVRPFDPLTRRLRLAQRPGLSKWNSTNFGGAHPIQFARHTNLNSDHTLLTLSQLPFWPTLAGNFNDGVGAMTVSAAPLAASMTFIVDYTPTAPYNTSIDIKAGTTTGGLLWGLEVLVKVDSAGNPTYSSTVTRNDGTVPHTNSGTWTLPTAGIAVRITAVFTPLKIILTLTNASTGATIATNTNDQTTTGGWAQTWDALNYATLTPAIVNGALVAAGRWVTLPVPLAHTTNDIADSTFIIGQNGQAWLGDPVNGFTGTGTVFNTSGEVSCVDAFGKAYVVDGTNIIVIDIKTQTHTVLTATAGTLPANCRLITLYRGRLVFTRSTGDPYNWFMSAVNNPLDYNYSSLAPDGAVSGNDADAGRVGDLITALIPFADTYMVMGCPDSLFIMRGDPKAGGTIDLLSAQVGITGPEAWAQGPDGTIYFMSRHGLYRMVNGGQPVAMSLGRVNKTLAAVDLTLYSFKLAWDGSNDCLWITAVPALTGLPQLNFVWNATVDGFFPDTYPAAIGPACLASATGFGGSLLGNQRRIILVCGSNGYIYVPDDNNFADDGTAIDSRCTFPPFKLGDGDTLGRVIATRFNWGTITEAFAVRYAYHVGNQPQDAAEAGESHSNTFSGTGGYQSIDRARVRGGALCVSVGGQGVAGTTWSLESALTEFVPAGRMRT